MIIKLMFIFKFSKNNNSTEDSGYNVKLKSANTSKTVRKRQVIIYFVKSFTKLHSYIVKHLTIGYTHLWILCEQLL